MPTGKCGLANPDAPEQKCILPPGIHHHMDGEGHDWADEVADKRNDRIRTRPRTKKEHEARMRELAGVSRPAREFVRQDDPDTSHQAMALYEPKRGTAKGRVLFYLREHLGEWVDAPAFHQPEVGGFAGTRRLRELREDGWPIETRPKPGSENTWQHRLIEDPMEGEHAASR